MKTTRPNPNPKHGRLDRVVGYLDNLGPRLQELAVRSELPPDVVEALVLDFESRWASMDVILAAYEGLPFHREVAEVSVGGVR